jgi:hypothetical protein
MDTLELLSNGPGADPAHDEVGAWVRAIPDLQARLGRAVRQALDEVIDGPRTGRWSYAQLEKTEKTYVGTKIEIVVRTALGLERIGRLDTVIAGHEVDFKWSGSEGWMIPTEAVDELCFLVSGDEAAGSFSAGLVRCTPDLLRPGANKDGKTSLSASGKLAIDWFVRGAPLRRNFIADMDSATRTEIMSGRSGQERIRTLFTRLPYVPIPRDAVETVAQQRDPMRRLRKDQAERLGGMRVLSAKYGNRLVTGLGYDPLPTDSFMAVPQAPRPG